MRIVSPNSGFPAKTRDEGLLPHALPVKTPFLNVSSQDAGIRGHDPKYSNRRIIGSCPRNPHVFTGCNQKDYPYFNAIPCRAPNAIKPGPICEAFAVTRSSSCFHNCVPPLVYSINDPRRCKEIRERAGSPEQTLQNGEFSSSSFPQANR